jgi:cytoskeleton protein RodZ
MQTIGERLEEARKKKGISIREAAEATKIRGDYLQKFESNHFDIGLTEIYTRGFLRTYCNFLKIPADRILNDYAALGRGDVRPRQPSREIYGRMDISVATAEAGDRTAPPPEPIPEPSHANRGPQRSRAGTALPAGPDPAVVFKYIKWGGVGVIVILIIIVLNAVLSNRSTPSRQTPAVEAPRQQSFTLIAVRPVQVMVHRAIGDNDGEQIFAGAMSPGESKVIPWTGELFIKANPPANLEIDLLGSRRNFSHIVGGVDRGRLPAPPAQQP